MIEHSRKSLSAAVLVATGILLGPAVAGADTVAGADVLLCTADLGTRCYADGECTSGPPWQWDLPKFIEVDLKQKRLASTKASGANLSTPIGAIQNDGEQIYLQGVENGRAFSLVINEHSGVVSAAFVLDGVALTVFGACTPLR